MKQLSQAEKLVVTRIFDRVNKISGDYYGYKTEQQMIGLSSPERWIMFPEKHVENIQEGKHVPILNCYICFENKTFIDNGDGRANCRIGVQCGNSNSVRWLQHVLKSNNKNKIIKLINSLDFDWTICTEHKIKDENMSIKMAPYIDNTVIIDTVAAPLTPKKLNDAITASIGNELKYGENYKDVPVISCSTIFNIYRDISPENFDSNVKIAMDLLKKILAIR